MNSGAGNIHGVFKVSFLFLHLSRRCMQEHVGQFQLGGGDDPMTHTYEMRDTPGSG